MTVGVLLHAFTGAVIGLVALGGNYPVPPEVLEVDSEWIPAATRLSGMLIAIKAGVPSGPLASV